MMKFVAAGAVALSLVGCASGGSGGSGGGTGGTMFDSPTVFSPEEFKSNPEKYSKTWTRYVGGGVDSFKKITIPTYTLEVQTGMYKVGKNKVAALLANADGARSSLTMGVAFPWQEHEAMMQEIASASYARLKEKFKNAGVEVVDWSAVKAGNQKAADFEKENFATTPLMQNENSVSVVAPGAFRVVATSPYSLSSLSRDAEISVFFPNFGVGYGYFDGETTPLTIAEGHGMSGVSFTPQVQVLSGSGFSYQSKWNGGVIALDKSAISNTPFVKKLNKMDDSRGEAGKAEESRRSLVTGLTGAASHDVKVSSSASVVYKLDIDAAKFKAAVLKELDAAEDIVVARYKSEL